MKEIVKPTTTTPRDMLSQSLRTVVGLQKEADGWTNLAKVGPALKSNGIDYKSFGYEKLFEAIRDFKDIFNWKVDKETSPGFLLVYVREKTDSEKRRHNALVRQKDNDPKQSLANDPKNSLMQWASLGDFSQTMENLKKLALNERWHYKKQNPKNPYPILSSYIKYTFYRLSKEGNKILIKDNLAAFNTGLVDRRYEPIFALLIKTPNALRPWRLDSFCIAGEDEGKEIAKKFNPLPPRAHYFDRVADMLYDTRSPDYFANI